MTIAGLATPNGRIAVRVLDANSPARRRLLRAWRQDIDLLQFGHDSDLSPVSTTRVDGPS